MDWEGRKREEGLGKAGGKGMDKEIKTQEGRHHEEGEKREKVRVVKGDQ